MRKSGDIALNMEELRHCPCSCNHKKAQ
jgi:hypothetical protein